MNKRNKIIYWIATVWLALGMISTALVQLMKVKEETEMISHLGYPLYFLNILGTWKILGAIVVLIPKFPLIKEWAYAGFFFAMSGAICSHLFTGNPIEKILPSILLLVLTIVSWLFRPESRRLTLNKTVS